MFKRLNKINIRYYQQQQEVPHDKLSGSHCLETLPWLLIKGWFYFAASINCFPSWFCTLVSSLSETMAAENPKSIYDFTIKVLSWSLLIFCYCSICSYMDVLAARVFKTFFSLFKEAFSLFFRWICSQDMKGNDVTLSSYRGKVVLIVNVASKWYFFLLPRLH